MRCPATGKECESGCENPEECIVNEVVKTGIKQAGDLIRSISIEATNLPGLQYLGTEGRLKMADRIADLIKKAL